MIWLSIFHWFSKKHNNHNWFLCLFVVLVDRFSYRNSVFYAVQHQKKTLPYLDRCFFVVSYHWYDFWFVCLSGSHVTVNSYILKSLSWIHDHWCHFIGRAELRIGNHLFISTRVYAFDFLLSVVIACWVWPYGISSMWNYAILSVAE